MDLIKKIKNAEQQAKKIVEQAKNKAAEEELKFNQKKISTLEQAGVQRKKDTDTAVEKAASQAGSELEKLKQQSQKQKQQLQKKADEKKQQSVKKIVDYLKS
jgi:vacuolar-type H+-ATPase subunit H